MPSSSSMSKLKTAIVPSDDTAYRVRPSVDLRREDSEESINFGRLMVPHQLKSIIWRSNTSFATMRGRADFVCHTDTERSSAPSATTEQIFDATTGLEVSRRKMWGLYDYE